MSSPSGDGDDGDDGGERPSVAACICKQTSLVPWLFEQIGRATYDPGGGGGGAAMSPHLPDLLMLHSSEVLSAILQHEDLSANMHGSRMAVLPRYADGSGRCEEERRM